MGWTQAFRETLEARSVTVEYQLRFFKLAPSTFQQTTGRIQEIGRIAISEEEIEITGVSVVPQNWGVTFGGFTINLTGDIRPIRAGPLRKGNIASLFMSRNGLSFERVCLGQLRSISGVRGRWTLEFVDVLTMLYQRQSNENLLSQFYFNAGNSTTVSSNFNFGSSPNLSVANLAIFEKDSLYDGMIKVTSGGTTDYWTYQLSGSHLVIQTTGNYPSTGTLTTLSIGDTVTNLARLYGRPDKILHRTLASIRGDGTEGTYDTYPTSYAVFVKWASNIFDQMNAGYWYLKVLLPSSTVDLRFDILYEAPVSEGIRSLLDKYALFGIWPVWRHNSLSIRSCQNLFRSPVIAQIITDEHIIEILSHQIYSSNQQTVYFKQSYAFRNASTSISIETTQNASLTIPASSEIRRDYSNILARDANANTAANSTASRMVNFDFYTFEEIELLVTERSATLVAGDVIMLTSSFIYGFGEAQGKTYQGKPAMVIGTVWRPKQRSVILNLAVSSI